MLSVSFQAAATAIVQVFAMGTIGYGLVRSRVIDENGLKLLSFLTVNIVFPLFIFYQIIRNFDPIHTAFWWGYPLINVGLALTGLGVTSSILWLRRLKSQDEFLAASSLHNAGYIPLLMAMSLPLGEAGARVYPAVILSIIGFDAIFWSVGVWILTRHQNPRMELKRIITPPLVSMLVAGGIVLAGGAGFFTETLLKPVKIMGDSALGITMLVIGGNLAMTNFTKIEVQRITGVVLIKLVLLPLMALTAVIGWQLDPIMSFVLMLQSCMPSSITLSIVGRNYDTRHQDFINQSIFFTHLLCIITIPVFLGLYAKLGH